MNNKKKTILIFLIFLILLLAQIHFVWIYYDDYGYASLSYLYNYPGNKGMNTNIADVISFLIYHYNTWGGRVLWFFVEIVLLKIGISAYRIAQSCITLGIFYLIYKIISKTKKIENYKIALTTVIMFGLIEIMVLRDGFYWFTASVLYLFPILPILLYIYLTYKDEKRKPLINILCIFLIFISAWSQEQVGMFIVAYVGLQFLYKLFIKKKVDKWDVIFLLTALLGYGILMLSPGTRIRVGGNDDFYTLSLIGKIRRNVPWILKTLFGEDTKIITTLLFSSIVYILFKNRKRFKYKWLVDTTIISTLIMMIIAATINPGYMGYMQLLTGLEKFSKVIIGIWCLQIFLTFGMLIISYVKNKEYMLASIVLASIASQAVMVMAPYMPHRSITIFEIMSFITILYVCTDIYKDKKISYNYILIPLLIIATCNYISITKGYYQNNSIKEKNDKLLKDVSKRIKKGEEIKEVTLEATRSLYGTSEPEGVYGLMKWYYDIPQEIEIKYGN